MIGRKVTILTAVLAIFVSSIAGGTALRGPSAKADDVVDTAEEVVQELKPVAEQEVNGFGAAANQLVDNATHIDLGIGETLVLVIAGQALSSQGAARLASVNSNLGELQGFALDSTDNYDLKGALVQISPDAVSVACDDTAATDCPEGAASVNQFEPVTLGYVTKSVFPTFAFPRPCGQVGLVPCQEAVYRSVVGSDLRFAPGQSIVVSGFRTKRGAEEFIELARAVGISDLVVVQALKLAGADIGLGQEPHPDGSGPLSVPLIDQESYQS